MTRNNLNNGEIQIMMMQIIDSHWLKFNEFVTLFEMIGKLEIQLFPVVHKLQSLQEKKK